MTGLILLLTTVVCLEQWFLNLFKIAEQQQIKTTYAA